MSTVAIGVTGRIASGKSTIASTLAERLCCPVASFGSYVRSCAIERGIDPEDRPALQELGELLIASLGWEEFCRRTLAAVGYAGGPIVVEGLRHLGAADALRLIVAPARFVLVAVDVDEEDRRHRIESRGIDEQMSAEADRHRGESEVSWLMESADIVVARTMSTDRAANHVIHRVREMGLVATESRHSAQCLPHS